MRQDSRFHHELSGAIIKVRTLLDVGMGSGLFGRAAVKILPLMPRFVVKWISRRYVAGTHLSDATKVMKQLSTQKACCTIDVLGEEISTLDEAKYFLEEYEQVIDAIVTNKLDANISIKPTAFGLLLDRGIGLANIERICRKADEHDMFVRLDMEDHRVTQDTIDVVLEMHTRGLTNVGTVLQSRLFRTLDDIEHICKELKGAADFRLCKGIYLEPESIAHTEYRPIVDAFCEQIDAALGAGAYVGIASHDTPVIEHALNALSNQGLGPEIEDKREGAGGPRPSKGPGYEFQFLLGVRGDVRRKLANDGHRTRVYVPYGERWYEYSVRRLRENPTIASHVIRAMLMPWTNRR